MTAPDRMPEAFENSLHDAEHPQMEPPANRERFSPEKFLMDLNVCRQLPSVRNHPTSRKSSVDRLVG